MPTLTIDNLSITVPEGTNVLQAAERLGIVIPHFCYHEALGSVGACRLCAMKFLDGPVKGIQMACMVEAKDGMVVSTLDSEAQEQRAHVIEWLMMNHPHDCPVCDEGGECQLQDMTVAGGHSIRRYRGKKRTYRNQYLGPLIEQEMNRCIQCYRCVRTYQDYCGGTDFGVLGSRQRLFFGRFQDGVLQSPFSGNLADVCPTGVFTDKTFRFRTRYWDLQEAPSVCPHCSLGCATIPGAHFRELQRVRAGVNPQTNGFFLCDRGRFGYGHANHPERPRNPRVSGVDSGWPEALTTLSDRLTAIRRVHGPDSILFLGSNRASLEANHLLKQWASSLGCDRFVYEVHPGRDRAARYTSALLGDSARSLEQIRHSDYVLTIGCDPVHEGPMLSLAIRQAVRKGGYAVSIDPRPVDLCCETSHLPLPPERLSEVLVALQENNFSRFPRREAGVLEGIGARLRQAKNPVLVGGSDLLGGEGTRLLLQTVQLLSTPDRPCGAFLLLAGPNSYGNALLSGEGPDFNVHLDAIISGHVRAMVCLETDPFSDHPDPARTGAALSRLEFLAVMDSVPTVAVKRADLFLPTTATAESAGTFVNNEGRLLPFEPVFSPGQPIQETGGGNHPPRTFQKDTPGDQPRASWSILSALLKRQESLDAVRQDIATTDPRFAPIGASPLDIQGVRVDGVGISPRPLATPLPQCQPENTFTLIASESLFGSEILSSFSKPLSALVPEPFALMHPDDALALGIENEATVRLTTLLGHLHLQLRLSDRMARRIILVPRLRGTSTDLVVPGGRHQDCLVERGSKP